MTLNHSAAVNPFLSPLLSNLPLPLSPLMCLAILLSPPLSLSASALFSHATPSSREDQREEERSIYLYSPLFSLTFSPYLLFSSLLPPFSSLPLYSSPLIPFLLPFFPPIFAVNHRLFHRLCKVHCTMNIVSYTVHTRHCIV